MTRNTSSNGKSGGIGFMGLLTLLFIALKLTGFITWSWWWVLAPIWMPLGILLTFITFCALMAVVTGQAFRRKRR